MAARWLARLRADDCTDQDRAAFQAWIAASAEHASSFEKVTLAWDLVGGCGPLQRPQPDKNLASVTIEPLAGLSRRRVLTGAAGFGLLAMGGAGYWQSAMAGTLETGIGEKRQLVMKDGTRLLMDALTHLRVPDMAKREIWLRHGRVDVQVGPSALPFAVHCLSGTVLCREGRFMAGQMTDTGLEVLAIEGKTQWSGQNARLLAAGERLVDRNGQQSTDKPDLSVVLAWQQGDAIFRDKPLGEAVAEMNRYSAQQLVLQDEALANKRVSGVYRLGDNSAFAISVAHLLDLHSQIDADEVRLSAVDGSTAE